MNELSGMDEHRDELVARELFRMILDEVLDREVHHHRVRGQKGQFEDLDPGEPSGRISRQCPDDIDDAVVGLVDQRGGLTAKVHGGINVDLQSAAGIRFDLFHPRRQHHGVAGRHGR